MKYPETHLGHSYGASVPSSEEMGLIKKTTSQQVMTAEEFWKSLPHCAGYPSCDSDSDLIGLEHETTCPLFGKKDLNVISFAEAYAQYYHESKSGK